MTLQQAVSNLSGFHGRIELANGSREALVSFVWIDTFLHHWPSRSTPELARLRDQFDFFKKTETSRFLKQRRIALRHLVRDAESGATLLLEVGIKPTSPLVFLTS